MSLIDSFILHRRNWVVPIALWTLIVAASATWNWIDIGRHTQSLALNQGQFVFKMVESMRLWNARHGGVYAFIRENSPPNPYLEVDDREIPHPNGETLTLINPAYMTRQVAGVVLELSGMRIKLTSLKPISPGNTPDDWERTMLEAFDRGGKEQLGLFDAAGSTGPRYRFIAPLVTQAPCLKCHEKQGYKVGDIRGGVSIDFDAAPLLLPAQSQRSAMILGHLAAWLTVGALMLLALARIRRQMHLLHQARAEQDMLVEQRTEQLRREVEDREEAEARVRLLIESSGEAIYVVDREGRCTLCNPVAVELLGLSSAEELIGRNVHEMIHHSYPDGTPYPEQDCALMKVHREGRPAQGDNEIFWRPDGTWFAAEYHANPLWRHGDLIGAIVTFTDVSVRKAREAQLRKLSSVVEHSPDSIVITDADGRIEYVNPRFLQTSGYSLEEVLGRSPGLLRSGLTPETTYEVMRETIEKGENWRGEFLNRRKDGALFWEAVSISPISDEMGRITHYVCVKEDITQRKEMEERIWRQANFDALTGLPNRNLCFDRLAQAIKDAEREEGQVGLVFIDLDRFKEVNDTQGHEAGDRLLKEVALRLTESVRRSDTVARMGGDEFVTILPRITSQDAIRVLARKIIERLSAPIDVGAGVTVSISASLGIALYPGDATDMDGLIRIADKAMYRAKSAGRNTCRFADDTNCECGPEQD